jgi:hypothetical protein
MAAKFLDQGRAFLQGRVGIRNASYLIGPTDG